MKLAFAYDARAWAEPRARWTIATLAPLLDAPWREVAPGAGTREDEAVVFVGDPAAAPAGAAQVIALGAWPALTAASMVRGEWEGVPMALPAGALEPAPAPAAIPAPWLAALWHALSREEEREDPRRDRWECYAGNFTRLAALDLLDVPVANRAAARLRARLDAWAGARGASIEREPRWPDGAPFAVALSHDVDDVRLCSAAQAWRLLGLARWPTQYAFRAGLGSLVRSIGAHGAGPDPYAQFERWAGEESKRGFRSTFYVFARPERAHEYDALYRLDDPVPFEGGTPTVGTMFRTLAERGFEIGLHGSYRSWRDAGALAAERAALAAATGAEVPGIRQHFLRFDVARTWDAQQRAGFTTDATLGYNEAVGFRAGIAAPFHPWDAPRSAASELLEVPLTLMDGALFRGLGLAPEAAVARTLAHLDSVEHAGGMAGLLWHPNVAAEEMFPGWWACYVAALDRLAERRAWVTTAGAIAEWWRDRARRLNPEAR